MQPQRLLTLRRTKVTNVLLQARMTEQEVLPPHSAEGMVSAIVLLSGSQASPAQLPNVFPFFLTLYESHQKRLFCRFSCDTRKLRNISQIDKEIKR
jgi:hypothetical protein